MSRGHRPSTTPMDFEWSNQTGPTDPNSPFLAASQQSAKKRPHSVLDSPSKNGFATPSRLRDPDNRPFFFAQDSNKPLPLPPHVQSAWEPRTPTSTYDFSSGGETPNTPQVDSDAATPDTQLASKMGRLGNGDSPKKGPRRESWFKKLTSMSSPSPTKEREPKREPNHYSSKADSRIVKRRSERSERSERSRSKKHITLRHEDDGDLSDAEQAAKDAPKKQPLAKSTIASFFSWIEAHPNLPRVFANYMQLTVNVFLGSLFIYVVYGTWAGIMGDVDIESDKHASEIMVEIAACAKEYNRNRCRPEDVVPAMEKACGVWETCMNRDVKKVARASVTAKTFAMIFNSFVEEFSYKSMIFCALLIFGGFNLSNWAFGLLRQQEPPQNTPNPNDFIPQTPHRIPSNSYIDQQQLGYQQGGGWQPQYTPYPQQQHTPYATPHRHVEAPPLVHTQSMPALPSVPQEGAGVLEEKKSSSRRRGLFR
ncbi:hypothetical protein ACN47E_001277 [Coniothyrium glycines]